MNEQTACVFCTLFSLNAFLLEIRLNNIGSLAHPGGATSVWTSVVFVGNECNFKQIIKKISSEDIFCVQSGSEKIILSPVKTAGVHTHLAADPPAVCEVKGRTFTVHAWIYLVYMLLCVFVCD